MKKQFFETKIELIRFDTVDVIVTSTQNAGAGGGDAGSDGTGGF